MSIERDSQIRFHELGTLQSVTRWIRSHDEGLAEWLKNSRRAYQTDRADVSEEHRTALLLFQDAMISEPARIGILDVGGASNEDVERWSTWQDPQASNRGSTLSEEETQGNGGKAYMYRLFAGPSSLLGVKDGRLNRKGMDGKRDSLERGLPGYVPDATAGRNREVSSWEAELTLALEPYDIRVDELPSELRKALQDRRSFTLVEGVDPLRVYNGRIDADELIYRLLRHDQSTLAVQQLRLYAAHNGRIMNGGRPLMLETIPPFPGFEQPVTVAIPEELPDHTGRQQSTTLDGKKAIGRLTLHTSRDNMYRKHKELRSRWKVSYRAGHNMIGTKSIGEVAPAAPGSQFIYATVELEALEPDYVALGRLRPNDGPLIEAIDEFVSDQIRELAKQINEHRRHELDESQLDELQLENQRLDEFKNQFLPDSYADGGDGPNQGDGSGTGGGEIIIDPVIREFDEDVVTIKISIPNDRPLRIGRDVTLRLPALVRPRAIGPTGKPVPKVRFSWSTSDRHVLEFIEDGHAIGRGKGTAIVRIKAEGTSVSVDVPVEVWAVDHVLLTPRTLQVEIGKRVQILAEVTNDEGTRSTDVLLNWRHDADDQLIVRIHPTGWVTGNRVGQTRVTAGAGDPASNGVWSRIQAEVEVKEREPDDEIERGSGFPQLLLTGKDVDPETGEIRPGDPEQPALWQEASDFRNNVWWLNLEHPAALYHFSQRAEHGELWRSYHAQKLVEMVQQVHMRAEYIEQDEKPDLWVTHKATLERIETQIAQAMWEYLTKYVQSAEGLD